MADAEIIERMYVEIVLGIEKSQSTVEMDSELSALWDQIASEVAQMKADGKDFKISGDLPAVSSVAYQTLADISVATWGAARAIADMNDEDWPTEQQLVACAELAISNHRHSDRLTLTGLILSYEHGTVSIQYDLMEYEEEDRDEVGWD